MRRHIAFQMRNGSVGALMEPLRVLGRIPQDEGCGASRLVMQLVHGCNHEEGGDPFLRETRFRIRFE